MSLPSLKELVRALELAPHPEGGFYRETYRAPLVIPAEALGDFAGPRAASTAIYFIVPRGGFSALHRIRSDEAWHFHLGAPLTITTLLEDGSRRDVRLGVAFERGEAPQAIVPAGAWFGARIAHEDEAHGAYSLVGCTVAPGFDFADFELASRSSLTSVLPQHAAIISELTRG